VIYRHRLLVGAKLQYYVVQLTVEAQLALAGTSVDGRADRATPCQPSSTTTHCAAKDTAGAQTTLSVSAGFNF